MKKECITKMGRFYPKGDHYSMKFLPIKTSHRRSELFDLL